MLWKIIHNEFRLLCRNPFYWLTVVLFQAGLVSVYFDNSGYSARHLTYSFYGTAFYAYLSFWAILFFAAMACREDEGLREMLLAMPVGNNQLIWGKFLGNFLGLLPLVLEMPAIFIGLSIYREAAVNQIWTYLPPILALYLVPMTYSASVGFAAGIIFRGRKLYIALIIYWLAAAFLPINQNGLFQFQSFWGVWMILSDLWGIFPYDQIINSKSIFYAGLSIFFIFIVSVAAFPRREKVSWVTIAISLALIIPVAIGGFNYFLIKAKDQKEYKKEFTQYFVPLTQVRAESEKVHRGGEEDLPLPVKVLFDVKSYLIDLKYNAQNKAQLEAELLVNLPKPQRVLDFTLRRNFQVQKVEFSANKATWENAKFERKGDGLKVFLPKGTEPGSYRLRLVYQGIIRHQRNLLIGHSILYYFVGREGALLPSYYGWYPLPGSRILSKAAAPDKSRPKEILAVAESFPVVDYLGPVIAEMTPNEKEADFLLRVTAPAGAELFSNLERKKVTINQGQQEVEFSGSHKRGALLIGGKLGEFQEHDITFLVSPDYGPRLEPVAALIAERVKFFEDLVPGSNYQPKLLVIPGTYSNIQRATNFQAADLIIVNEYSLSQMLIHPDQMESFLAPGSTFSLGVRPLASDFDIQLLSNRWKVHDRKMFWDSNPVAAGIMQFQQFLAFREGFGAKKYQLALKQNLSYGKNLLSERRKAANNLSKPLYSVEVLTRLVELEAEGGLENLRPVLGRLYSIAQERSLTSADFWTVAGLGNK